ncbi:eye-specific diacylglycerol kinase isoform X2 [Copidosoma floridanum]|uniref:eye-specific diacylglycerol kinase isoform X2 n=1 Tax=Copidosoma floridanum TaxID=29053 RepID=UPI000C6FB1E0|nr:eye-specific diacylglycerol kinase isoform X2 [Copidosoma floridanum]
MQRLRSTFKRSRTPTGAEMKAQSSLEVPKQVRSASFDEIQLADPQRHELLSSPPSSSQQQQAGAAELRSIANLAMATSSSPLPTSPTHQQHYQQRKSTTGANLRVPQLAVVGQRSRSFDVAERPSSATGLLDRSSSTVGGYGGYVMSRGWRSSAERENPPAQAYSCWHCACVDEWRARQAQASDSWEDEDDEEAEGDDGDDEADEADYYEGNTRGGDDLQSQLLLLLPPPTPQQQQVQPGAGPKLERDVEDNSLYFVVLQKASEDAEDECSDCSRREGSPEIRVTLTPSPCDVGATTTTTTNTTSAEDRDYSSASSSGEPRPPVAGDAAFLVAGGRQRRRSLSRQEALTVFPSELPTLSLEATLAVQSSLDEEEHQQPDNEDGEKESRGGEEAEEEVEEDSDGAGGEPVNKPGQLVVRDIFLTVPDLKRDRAASVDSCFNNNKNGGIESGYSLQVPQQSARSKSVDIVLPTEAQTRYTALLPGNEAAFPGQKDEVSSPGQREPRSTPDWSDSAVNGEHLWVPTSASGEFCYVNDCSKHGARLKCSACRVVAHSACTASLGFQCKPSYRDIGVRQYREQKVINHHWVHRRSQKGKCTNCNKAFQSKLSFSSKEIIAVSCSWCKHAYHNRESCFNPERIGEQCELGTHESIIVPPSWIVKLPRQGKLKSSLRKSPRKRRSQARKQQDAAGEKEDPLKLWAIKPIPNTSVTPVLVFINPRSGGNQGAKLLSKFQWLLNPRQVFDLTQGGPNMGLELFKKVPNLRILACGGDGTVGWVLSVLDKIGANPPPAVGTLPLGTGNDLARALGWGGGYTDEPINKILDGMAESEISILDRWKLEVERNNDAQGNDEDAAKGKENLPLNVVNNYFSLGVDAHIALEFHEAREAHPERFNSRLRNKMFYGQMGGKDLVIRRWKDLSEYVTLECDGNDLTSKLKEHRVHAILFLNIDSYGGGTHPWGGGIGQTPTTEDSLIEVVGLTTYQLPLLQAGGHGTSLAQCSSAKIVTTKTIPMQVDGEACRLLPSVITLSLLNKATMLAKRRGFSRPRKHQKTAEPEKLKIPLMRIKMPDYENYHSDRERLVKTATLWMQEPLDLDAAMDLESLRKMLAKDYPMDTCCFLDSCTAERFFRIDRAQEQLHYVADVVSDAIYLLHENPLPSSQADNHGSTREDRRKADRSKSRNESARSGDNNTTTTINNSSSSSSKNHGSNRGSRERSPRDTGEQHHRSQHVSREGSAPAKSRHPSGGSRHSRRSDARANEEDPRMTNNHNLRGGTSKQSSSKSNAPYGGAGHAHHHKNQPIFISPQERLFGLGPEVLTFHTELLERTSDDVLRAAKVGDLVGLKALHERGYSLLSIDATGQTALHVASRTGCKDIVRYLIACAPPTILNMVDNDKFTEPSSRPTGFRAPFRFLSSLGRVLCTGAA